MLTPYGVEGAVGVLFLASGAVGQVPWLAAAPVAGVFIVLTALSMTPTFVEVGDDGVTIEWREHHRFIPLARIRRTHTAARVLLPGNARLDLELDDDEIVRLMTSRHQLTDDGKLAASIARAIDDAKRATDTAEAPPTCLVERGPGEAATDFVERLRRMGRGEVDGASSFRSASVPLDEWERRLFDARTDGHERAAAAIVLAASSNRIDSIRLLDVVERTANPALRCALVESGGAGDLTALCAALDDLAAARCSPEPRV